MTPRRRGKASWKRTLDRTPDRLVDSSTRGCHTVGGDPERVPGTPLADGHVVTFRWPGRRHCPVLVLRGGEGAWPPERVIFGDDGSEAARAAGDLAAVLCGRRGAQGLVLHAYPQLPEVDAEGRESDPRMADDELRQAEKVLLERAAELEEPLGYRPQVRLVVGEAAAHLLGAAEEQTPERTLLAVGSRGLGAIGRMRLGSVSTKVLHAAEGPVLVHPAPREEA